MGEFMMAGEEKPVFIVGMPRSGTTLLSMILNAHSQLAILPETHYFDKYFARCETKGCLKNRDQVKSFINYILDGPEVRDMGYDKQTLSTLRRKLLMPNYITHRDIFENLMATYASKQGKPQWGEKTPGHFLYVRIIANLFPSAKFVCVIRDPRDVSLSLRKVPWSRAGAFAHAIRWRRFMKYSSRYLSWYGSRYIEIRYEDLLSEPATVIRQVCSFLDMQYEPEMLRFHEHADPNFDVVKEPWKAKNLQPLDSSNMMKWQHAMPAAEVKLIELTARSMIQSRGYGFSTLRWNPVLLSQASMIVMEDLIRWLLLRLLHIVRPKHGFRGRS